MDTDADLIIARYGYLVNHHRARLPFRLSGKAKAVNGLPCAEVQIMSNPR